MQFVLTASVIVIIESHCFAHHVLTRRAGVSIVVKGVAGWGAGGNAQVISKCW